MSRHEHEADAATKDGGLDRRGFLRIAAGVAVGGAATASATAGQADPGLSQEVDAFLARYVERWLPLDTKASEAAWAAATDVTEAHTTAQVAASQAVNEVVGAPEVIADVTRFLAQKDKLNDIQARQLEKIRLRAAEAPGTLPEVVKARTEAEARQSAAQDGFVFTVKKADGTVENPSANKIDQVLISSKDLDERKLYWTSSKEIGGPLRDGVLKLRDLRNQVARKLGFDDFFALQVADYGMTVPQMLGLCDGIVADVKPLYLHLHTWTKHLLAKRYGADVPKGAIPAHWLPNRWGQNWPSLVEGVDMDAPFKGRPREFITEQAERFYTSIGFPKLPPSFWTKSDLYPADPKTGRKKNSHASAWHIDLRDDVRSLMSIEPDNQWFGTAHHELGHIYYYMSYSTPKVPYLLRAGANRAFHEGIGDLIGLASGQRPYLKQVGLLTPEAEKAPAVTFLLDTALDGASVVFLPWSAGVMTHFERDFYAGTIADDALNAGWWRHVRGFQGIEPPAARPETLCDAATKTHINDDPAQYYDYAIGTVLKFQLHDHIAREILKQDPRECNYFGNKKVGDFLRGILELGATRDWNAVLREATGEGLTARPLVAYFDPLLKWLETENKGRALGWPETTEKS
ncbi:MAG: M2 family metallopeptidase [Paludisphaera borealis]|uniref:M2 family metallopeptidase n=1 Tax=Paludisphaera borealis TaxID=1387353 RepID=UPI00284A2EE3|nr:M2 family metallopeptidase [Paludisphaera borealis]MDR3618448.1 M2 family metallopeptidase [Paludisphaera borealis]